MSSVVEDAIRTERKYGFKFQVCDRGTKGEGSEKGWLDHPLNAQQVRAKCSQKLRNLKLLTGEVSGYIALDIDKMDVALEYRKKIGAITFRVRTSRGYAWVFKQPKDVSFNKIVLPDGSELLGNRHSRTFSGRHPSGKDYAIECEPDGPLPEPPDWLLTQIRLECDKRARAVSRPQLPPMEGDIELAAKALAHLDPDMPYDEWIAVGMALFDLDPSGGLALWDSWSSGGSKYKPGLCAGKWRSFHKGLITRGRLFWMADNSAPGWRPAPIRVQRTIAPNFHQHRPPVEPAFVTKRMAAEINRFFQHQADAVLEVYRAVMRFFREVSFTAKQLIERSRLSKAQVHRGLMYGKSFIFELSAEEPHNDDLVALCTRESKDSIDKTLLDDPNSLQSATKSISTGSRPSTCWKLIPYERAVRIMCYWIFYVDLERSMDFKLATSSRVRDLKGDPSFVGRINRTLQKLMSIEEVFAEKEKLRKMALKIRYLRYDLLHDLQQVGEGHHQTGKCEEKSVRQLMAEEWHWDRRDTDKTWDCERVLGMAKSTVQRMGRAVGFRWKPKMEPQVVTRGCDLPTPHKYSLNQHGFPRSVIVGGTAKPYFSAHYVAERMEVLNAPATIMWQKGSTIVYEPNEAALEADHKGQSNGKRKTTKPVRGECGSVGMEQPEWNYQGNPPNWSRVNWAYYWLNRMGYKGDFDDLTDYQILEMLSTDRGTLKGEQP